MKREDLQKILENHSLWLRDEGGERANLSGADLSGADLSGVNLCGANLCGAYLRQADLSGANLSGADLRGADLSYANLRRADLSYANLGQADLSVANLSCANLRQANLSGTDLSRANLSGAYLSGADLREVSHNENTAFFALQCPEEGSFIAWKKCQNNVIVKLLIPEDAKRSSATSRKCRASKAIVLEVIGAEQAISTNDMSFVYEVGKEVVPDSFDDDRWNECSHGVHFFMTRKEAENY